MNPARVEDGEKLGHGVFDGRNAGRVKPRSRFFEDAITHGLGCISVDRLDHADWDVLCEVHDEAARARGEDRSFYGWFSFTSDLVRSIGLTVDPTQSEDPRNLWHADVLVPNYDSRRTDRITEYADALKSESNWTARPLSPTARKDIAQASGGLN
jgi:hypothetical protein